MKELWRLILGVVILLLVSSCNKKEYKCSFVIDGYGIEVSYQIDDVGFSDFLCKRNI